MKKINLLILALAATVSFNTYADTLGVAIGAYDIDGSNSAADF